MRIAIAMIVMLAATRAHAGGALKAKLSCKRYASIDTAIVDNGKPDAQHGDDAPDPAPRHDFHFDELCKVHLDALPAGTVVATFRQLSPRPPVEDDAPTDQSFDDDDDGGFAARATFDPSATPDCKPYRIEASIRVDGKRVWTGRTSYTPPCEHLKAHLVCKTPDDKPVGRTARLDRDVTCEVDLDSPASGDIEIDAAVTRPIDTPTIRHDGNPAGDVTFAAGTDLLPCAPTTFHAAIVDRHVTRWRASLAIAPRCPRPRAAAKLTCTAASACTIAIARAPAEPLRAWFASDLDGWGDVVTADVVGAEVTATLAANPIDDDQPCRPAYARAALSTVEGAVAWTGKFAVRTCPKR